MSSAGLLCTCNVNQSNRTNENVYTTRVLFIESYCGHPKTERENTTDSVFTCFN